MSKDYMGDIALEEKVRQQRAQIESLTRRLRDTEEWVYRIIGVLSGQPETRALMARLKAEKVIPDDGGEVTR